MDIDNMNNNFTTDNYISKTNIENSYNESTLLLDFAKYLVDDYINTMKLTNVKNIDAIYKNLEFILIDATKVKNNIKSRITKINKKKNSHLYKNL